MRFIVVPKHSRTVICFWWLATIVFLFGIFLSNNVYASCSIGIETDDGINISLMQNVASVVVDDVKVETECVSGYNAFVSISDDSNLYKNGDNSSTYYIRASSGTIQSPTTVVGENINTYGYSLDTEATAYSSSFIGLTTHLDRIKTSSTASAVGGDMISVLYAASVPLGTPAGTYSLKEGSRVVYYAVANPAPVVTFNPNGGTIPAGAEWEGSGSTALKEIESRNYGALPTPVREGYVFWGWLDNDDPVVDYEHTDYIVSSTPVTNNMDHTLYAVWERDYSTIGFNVIGNPTEWTNQSVTLTIEFVDPSDEQYFTEYSFDGGITWQSSKSKTYDINTSGIVVKAKDIRGNFSAGIDVDITKIDKTPPTIGATGEPIVVTLDESNIASELIGVDDDESGVNASTVKMYRNDISDDSPIEEITNTTYFTRPGLYSVQLEAYDNAGNATNNLSKVLVRWPTAGKYVVKKTELDGIGISGEGKAIGGALVGLYKDTVDTGYDNYREFSSKYYYSGATVDNYVSFGGKTFRILNIPKNDDIKLIGNISGSSVLWGNKAIYDSSFYDSMINDFSVNRALYRSDDGEYFQFSTADWAHVDTGVFYPGRFERIASDTLAELINAERISAIRLGGDNSPSFESKVALPNVSDYLKACNYLDVVYNISTSQDNQSIFRNNNWLGEGADQWTINSKLDDISIENDFWSFNRVAVTHNYQILSASRTIARAYRPVFYLKEDTILSGSGTNDDPFMVQEDWSWFDDAQELQ